MMVTNSLAMGGRMFLMAWGRMIKRMFCVWERPRDRAAFRLSAVNGLDTRPDDLGQVGAGVEGQGHHAGQEPVKADEAEELERRQIHAVKDHVVDDEQLNQHRGGPEHFHIHGRDEPNRIEPAQCRPEIRSRKWPSRVRAR